MYIIDYEAVNKLIEDMVTTVNEITTLANTGYNLQLENFDKDKVRAKHVGWQTSQSSRMARITRAADPPSS